MENRKNMNIVWAIIIILVVFFIIFINVKDTTNMMPENSSDLATEIAKAGDIVMVNYTGKLVDGTVFDSNIDPNFKHVEPFVFTLGTGQVIAGWDKGIAGMKVGEKKILTISPEDGYGPNGYGPIPPNATLIFEVELVKINK